MRRFEAWTLKWLVIGLMVGPSAQAVIAASDFSLSENDGFCLGGAPGQEPFQTWGTYCAKGDAAIGHAATRTFRLTGPFALYLSGNPGGPDLNLRLENVSDHKSLDIRPDVGPGAQWLKVEFALPDSWRGKDLRLVADDRSTGPMGWLAFGSPIAPDKKGPFREAKGLLLKTPLLSMLIFVPGFTLCALAISRGVRGTVKLGMVMLAGIAVPGYFLFFLYVHSAKAAYAISAILPYLLAAVLLFLLFRLPQTSRRLLLPFLFPLALTVFASLGILSLGYFYGGSSTPNATASHRFSHPLPPDNMLPYLFAQGLRKGEVPRPLQGDWLSSDRPPLQTGMVLALEPWMKTQSELGYHVVSAVIQSLWIFAVWLLMKALRISKLTTAVILSTIYLSGFTIVNTFYVWPKLLAGAYMIAFSIPILTGRPQRARGSWLMRCVMAFLLACSLLSHGGTVFALLGLMIFMAIRYRRLMFRESCLVAAMMLVFYSPWIGYQKFVDPPGDRLLKYHLAGVEQVTNESALKTIYEAYRKLTFAQWVSVKEANTMTAFGHEREYLRVAANFFNPKSQAAIRGLQFFFFLPTLGFVGLGTICMLLHRIKKRNRQEMEAAGRLLLWALITTVPWIILLFIPSMTVVHAGAYAMDLTAMAGSILAFRSIAPRLAIAICLLQCTFNWIVYEPDLTHVAFPASLMQTRNSWMLALHVVSLGGFFALLAVEWITRSRQITRRRGGEFVSTA